MRKGLNFFFKGKLGKIKHYTRKAKNFRKNASAKLQRKYLSNMRDRRILGLILNELAMQLPKSNSFVSIQWSKIKMLLVATKYDIRHGSYWIY